MKDLQAISWMVHLENSVKAGVVYSAPFKKRLLAHIMDNYNYAFIDIPAWIIDFQYEIPVFIAFELNGMGSFPTPMSIYPEIATVGSPQLQFRERMEQHRNFSGKIVHENNSSSTIQQR